MSKKTLGIAIFVCVAFFVCLFAVIKHKTEDAEPLRPSAHINVEKKADDMNHLGNEKSPYLLQHKDNPVNWYPWGHKAFEKAKREDKLIFLSIGYSTCHWCHVMEHESFEDEDIARVMNEHYVSIKVDREERPDIDNIYMQAVMMMTGSGGWPLSVFLTPDKRPFTGGTYFPPDSRWGRPGFKDILISTNKIWREDRQKVLKAAESLTGYIQSNLATQKSQDSLVNEGILISAARQFAASFDPHYGGFGGSPKFPRSHSLSFLLRYWKRTNDEQALGMVEKTLAEMAKGGMYDQIGGGFHRYSTDEYWHVPHFEKMLYDQALLAMTYLEAYQATQNESYAHIARDILDYVLRVMTDENGGFYSAEDADSLPPDDFSAISVDADTDGPRKKSEGAFYIWEEGEIMQLLGEEAGEIVKFYYGVKPHGNAETDPHGEFRNKNIFFIANSTEETAKKFNRSAEQIGQVLDGAKKKLFETREGRPRPHLDDKILVDWNGLMIASFAFASRVLDEPRYLTAARNSAHFIITNLVREDGRLLHRYRDGQAGIPATIEDYAFIVHGLIELYQADFRLEHLQEAVRLNEEMIRLFWDKAGGGFFFVGKDAEEMISKQKEIYDGAIPSGNSVAALNLLRLSRLTMNGSLERKAEELTKTFAETVKKYPSGYPQLLNAVDYALGPSNEVVLAGNKNDETFKLMVKNLYQRFLPNKIVLHRPLDEKEAEKVIALSPFIKVQAAIDNQTTAYVCEDYRCKIPTTELIEFISHLENKPIGQDTP